MDQSSERRRRTRHCLAHPYLGAICPKDVSARAPSGSHNFLFIDIHNLSEMGALIECSARTAPGASWSLIYKSAESGAWNLLTARTVWTGLKLKGRFLAGLEFMPHPGAEGEGPGPAGLCPGEIEFLADMLFMKWIPRHAFCDLLNCLERKTFSCGQRIIRQGGPGDYLYIIQKGTCRASVEKDGKSHPVGLIAEGGVFGEMALLTGEPRSAHVDAETDVIAWKLSKGNFEKVEEKFHDLVGFLTELVASRFESSTVTADRRIGKYIIKRKIGTGGWSLVYEGAHERLRFPVAIKMMRHDMALDPGFAERFKNEAQLIAGMNHRNIVRVYDIEERFRTVFMIMEYLEGHSLENILRLHGRLSPARAVNFLVQACTGLGYAHRLGVVHQDIKPANMFVLPGDRVKILDFGLACATGAEDFCFLGTVYYTAPEQILGQLVGPATDIYALGITAYEMLTGARPYPESDLNALLDMHLNIDIADPAEAVPELPEPLRKFILKACSRKVKERYQTAEEALEELLPLARDLGCSMVEGEIQPARRISNLLISYTEEQALELKRLLERFDMDLRSIGIRLKSADFDV